MFLFICLTIGHNELCLVTTIMDRIFRDEFHLINLKLDFKEPSYFVNSQVSNEFGKSSLNKISLKSTRCYMAQAGTSLNFRKIEI